MLLSFVAVSKHRTLQAFEGTKPSVADEIFIAPSASVIGNVQLGKRSSVWYNAILRGEQQTLCANYLTSLVVTQVFLRRIRDFVVCWPGDVNSITVGENTNIQDGVVIHVAKNNPEGKPAPTVIGNNVTIGTPLSLNKAR